MRKITADYMISGGKMIAKPLIEIDDNGVVVAIEANFDGEIQTEYFKGLLIPGLVNAHSHIEYSFVEGKISEGGGLPRFIESIIENKYKSTTTVEERAEAARKVDEQMYNEGIVAVGDHNNNDYVYDVKCNSKIYYHSLVELYDVDNQDDDTTFHDGIARAKAHEAKGLKASVIPHACYTMSDRLLSLCGGSQVSNAGVVSKGILSIHYKESVEMAGDKESDRVFAALSPERSSSILVHAIYASQEDISRAQTLLGERLTIAICPLSNYYIEDRMADIEMLRTMGVNIAIGSDSLSSNRVISMVAEMVKISEIYPTIPLTEVVDWATINGARALGIDSWAGSIEVGKSATIVNIANFDGTQLNAESQGVRVI